MSNCSGCGGKGRSHGGFYGHILGCGTPDEGIGIQPKHVEDPRYAKYWNEMKKAEQLGIIKYALHASGLDPKFAKTIGESFGQKLEADPEFANMFADAFALKLGEILRTHSVDCAANKDGECQHVVQKPHKVR